MSEKKLLTLCIPTYNRGIHLEEQLKRLSLMPAELWNDISVFVSDNCSTDGTENIAKRFVSLPNVDIIYSRNESNLGMDGNFVKCFTYAKTKYVWLLGDDDYIKINKLSIIVDLLKKTECGVCHLGIHRKDSTDYTLFENDVETFLREIGIWISFISSNIVQTKYVPEIDFQKYYGSFFTLIPLYLTAMIKESKNVMVNIPIFEDAKDAGTNGGYCVAQVFVENYLSIFDEFVQKGQLSKGLYEFEEKTVFNFTMPFVVNYVLLGKPSNFKKENTWPVLFNHYGYVKPIVRCAKILCGEVLREIRRK